MKGLGGGTAATEPSGSAAAREPVRRIYAVGFADATGLGMYLALSAIYLSQGIGMSNHSVALVLGITGAASLIGAVPVARFADKRGLRRSLTLLFLARSLSFAGLSLAPEVWTAALAAAAGGLLNRAIGPLIQSALIVDKDQQAAVTPLARLRTLRNAGMAIGALPTGLVVGIGEEWAYRSVMAGAAAVFVFCALASRSFPPAADSARAKQAARPRLLGNGSFLWVTALFGALTLSAIVLGVGLPLWITQSTHASPWSVSLVQILNTVLVVLLQVRVSRGSERPRRARHMMVAGGFLAAAGTALAPLSAFGSGWGPVGVIILVVVVLTAAELYVVTGATSLALIHIPQEHRSAYLATFNLGFGAATVLGPPLVSIGLGLGTTGWLAWSVVFVIAGCASLTVPMAPRGHVEKDGRRETPRTPTDGAEPSGPGAGVSGPDPEDR